MVIWFISNFLNWNRNSVSFLYEKHCQWLIFLGYISTNGNHKSYSCCINVPLKNMNKHTKELHRKLSTPVCLWWWKEIVWHGVYFDSQLIKVRIKQCWLPLWVHSSPQCADTRGHGEAGSRSCGKFSFALIKWRKIALEGKSMFGYTYRHCEAEGLSYCSVVQ